MKKILSSSALYLVISIIIGCMFGFILRHMSTETSTLLCKILVSTKSLSGQVIFSMVPFLILGCVTPAIAKMNGRASKILLFSLLTAYISSVASAFISLVISHVVVSSIHLGVQHSLSNLPENSLVNFTIPTIHPMCALAIAIIIGFGIAYKNGESIIKILNKFQKFILSTVSKVMMPILPLFIGSNFALLTYSGQIANMSRFLPIIAIVVVCQSVWIILVYALASMYSGKNGWVVLKHYAKASFTALGSMSSMVTLPVSLECIRESKIVDQKIYDFTIPMFSNSNLCGSIIAEIALVMAVYYSFYQTFPPVINIVLFSVIACLLSIGSPGVPGGLNVACSSILGSLILNGGQIDTFMGIMTALYTLQDGFGTACNVVTGGALTIIVEKKLFNKTSKEKVSAISMAVCN